MGQQQRFFDSVTQEKILSGRIDNTRKAYSEPCPP
jgi:hypothetical protein